MGMSRSRKCQHVSACLIVASFLPAASLAQIAFERTYGGAATDRGQCVRQTQDGGYIIAGRTWSFGAGAQDVYLVRTDSLGDTLWTRTYGGPSWDGAFSVQQTIDGGFITAGYTYSFGGRLGDVYVIKTDSLGYTLWERIHGGVGGDLSYSVQQTHDGGYVAAGITPGPLGDYDVYVVKLDSSGDTEWARTCGGFRNDIGYCIEQTRDGGYVVAGETMSWGAGDYDVYLVKLNSAGYPLWSRTYGGDSPDAAMSVQQTSDGGFVISGWTASFGTGPADVYLLKTDSAGYIQWTRIYGGPASDVGQSVRQVSEGGYVIAGWTGSFGAGAHDIWVIRTDALGDTLWTRLYGAQNDDAAYSVQETQDGGYIVAGYTESFGAGESDVYLIKMPPRPLLVAGGGWIAGERPGPENKRTFAFNAHSDGGKVWGQLQFHDHRSGLNVHSDTVKALAIEIGDTLASCSGDCLVRELGGQLVPYSFECQVADRGEPGRGVDKFSIAIYDADGNLYYSAGDFLGGGNIQIHTLPDDSFADRGYDSETELDSHSNPLLKSSGRTRVAGIAPRLLQNSPNPFSKRTSISFNLPKPGYTTLRICDISGGIVKTLMNEPTQSGDYSVDWDGKDEMGSDVPTGVYFCQLSARGHSGAAPGGPTRDWGSTKKMVMLR